MPADRIGDLGRQFETRMETLASALTGGEGSPFEEPLDGDVSSRDNDVASTGEDEVVIEAPTGASQEAVEAAIRRVESDEQERRQTDDERVVA